MSGHFARLLSCSHLYTYEAPCFDLLRSDLLCLTPQLHMHTYSWPKFSTAQLLPLGAFAALLFRLCCKCVKAVQGHVCTCMQA